MGRLQITPADMAPTPSRITLQRAKKQFRMIRNHTLSGLLAIFALLFVAGCDTADDAPALPAGGDRNPSAGAGSGTFEVTFFPGEASGEAPHTRAAISGPSDRVQSLVYILYRRDASDRYVYVKRETVFRPDNYSVPESHDWPLAAIHETLPDGDYRVVFLGNLDANLFEGQGQEAVLQNYMTYYDEARMVMPAKGPLAFTDRNMFYFASADFNQNNTQVEILLQRIVTKHEFLREFVDANAALSQLVDSIARDIREKQLTTDIVGGLLYSALLDPVTEALGLGGLLFATEVVDALVGALTGDLIEALNKVLLQELLTRLESTLKANDTDADLLGLQNLLNPWAISSSADVTGYFTPSLDFDLQPVAAADQAAVTWEEIPMQRTAGEELSSERYLSMILLGGDNRIDKIDVKKEGLVGPLVDGVVDDPVLYGRLINIDNDLTYTALPNVAYHTNYAFLNLTLDDYGTSDDSEQLHLTAKLDSALVTKELLNNLLGDLLGGLLGSLLTPLLNTVTHVLDTTTFALDVKLPDLSIQNIVVEGGWEPTTSSVDGGN